MSTHGCGLLSQPPDLPDAGQGTCCIGAAVMGPEHCTCWVPVYDADQQEITPGLPLPPVPVQMCATCAYKPSSPERRGDDGYAGDQGLLDDLVMSGTRPVFEAVQIPLNNRAGEIVAYTFVDLADARLAEVRWYLAATGYAMRIERIGNGKRRALLLHREVMGLAPGDPSVDHINGDKLDNRRSNLRVGRQCLNLQNRGPNSGHPWARGVTYDAARRKWAAYVKLDGRKHFLGRYTDPEEAAGAASEFRSEHMPWSADARRLDGITPFYCHQGIRKPIAWRHPPSGTEIPGHPGGYDPPIQDGVPYKADGSPAFICAGWLLRRAKEAERQGEHAA